MTNIGRLRAYVQDMTRLIEVAGDDEARMLNEGRELLGALVAQDDWLPDAFAKPHPEYFQQYLLYCDPLERFSVVSFVWGPGQMTPIHDHTVWGLVGQLRGAERETKFDRADNGALTAAGDGRLLPGEVTAVSPTIGDIHIVANDMPDKASVSIHVYGANIGAVARHAFEADSGEAKDFVSGYSSTVVPNLWDMSEAVRATY
ncbi:MAG: cysteine dioxygenase [Alphaproteobacteria bacterium]|jgi:predicted metal-dependent enzyme (double-stranded beta helix superfamily)|nr:cysteine dioxygenase [Alphaproteobacteria bacterium]